MTISDTIRREGDNAEAELTRLRQKAETLMEERVTPAVAAIADQASHAAHAAQETVRTNVDALAERVRAQPLTALGVAALAGFVLAALTRR
jgi:ElaB/YqjD/DUF883 family membrane-anchored ribosome-binding protein